MLDRVLNRWKSFRSRFREEPPPSHETIRRWLKQRLDLPGPLRISPVSYGHNRSYRIEMDTPPHRALLKTYQYLSAHDRQRNEAASLNYLAPILKGTVPEVYAAALNEQDAPWLLLEWKEGLSLAKVFENLNSDERSELIMQCGRLCRKMHDLKFYEAGPLAVGKGRCDSWADFFFGQCDRLLDDPAVVKRLNKRLMEEARRVFFHDGPDLLNEPVQPAFCHIDSHVWNVHVAQRGQRWEISGLFDFEYALMGDPRLDLAWTEYIHEIYLPAAVDRPSFSSGYGEDIDAIPIEVKRLYKAYAALSSIRFSNSRGETEGVERHRKGLEGILF